MARHNRIRFSLFARRVEMNIDKYLRAICRVWMPNIFDAKATI